MRRIRIVAMLSLFALLTAFAACAFAADELVSKAIEESFSFEDTGIRADIDQWCYVYADKRAKTYDLRFYVAHVYVEDPAQMQTAFARDEYSKVYTEETSVMAARHGAFIAISGDYYNNKGDDGLLIRNGVLYRDKKTICDQLLVYDDGRFEAIRKGEFEPGHGQEYLDAGVVQSFTFGPLLVDDGEIVEIPGSYIISTKETQPEPRAAIGQVEENHYVLLVADGRRNGWSEQGMTFPTLQQVLLDEGCRIAYNLDGGNSATLAVNGECFNKPGGARERPIGDIIYFVAK